MPCSITLNFDDEERTYHGSDFLWFECAPSQKGAQELYTIQFRDGARLLSMNGAFPLCIVDGDGGDIVKKGFEEGIPVARFRLDSQLYRSDSTAYDSYLYLLRFIQYAGTFTTCVEAGGYNDRWTIGAHSAEDLELLLDSYSKTLQNEECIGCGEYWPSGGGEYCAECWVESHHGKTW